MADIITPQKKSGRRVHALHIDLTPMVDLGFLLITFFMLSTTLAEQRIMKINMPGKEPGPPTVFVEEATITLIPVSAHRVLYYCGALRDSTEIKMTETGKARAILLRKQKEVSALPAKFSVDAHRLHVLIKPGSDCVYADLVSLFDEMSILGIERYALVDMTAEDNARIAAIH